ncbi:unnamed protein product [Adineta steineri]|uniref:Uncharacterized protein n=1 Tax=Adineta steineri TaxID=433720 RepID=A0A814QVV6_9BILA|nr:unnamed protein product [Adineta steineri]CAF1124879.1 unnamed protein product [Adineta steineri]
MDNLRKYSINISLNEAIDQLNTQLQQLLDNTQIDFSKRKKILLQLERKHNQYRRSIEQTDLHNQRKLIDNNDLIRRIKKKIIHDDRQQQQRRRVEQEQVENNHWLHDHMTFLVGAALTGVLCAATFIIMMLDNSKEKYI